MKVLKDFYCIKEAKTYKIGDTYNGKRKDLKGCVNYPKRTVKKK